MPIRKKGTPLGYRKEVIEVGELRRRLRKGTVKFRFQKLNGSIRKAVGTQLLSQIPSKDWPINPGSSSPKVATFYDRKKGAWRCVSRRGDHIHTAIDQLEIANRKWNKAVKYWEFIN